MEYNPELERAEAELQESFRKEREAQSRRPHAKWTDHIIFFAAMMHFTAAVAWAGVFLLAPVFMASGQRNSSFIVIWILSIPSALVSLGVACALERVLDLTSPLRLKPVAWQPHDESARPEPEE